MAGRFDMTTGQVDSKELRLPTIKHAEQSPAEVSHFTRNNLSEDLLIPDMKKNNLLVNLLKQCLELKKVLSAFLSTATLTHSGS